MAGKVLCTCFVTKKFIALSYFGFATLITMLSLSSGPGSGVTSPGKKSQSGGSGGEGEDVGGKGAAVAAGGASNKPHLRVVIPGQKEFVPRTVSQ